MNKKSFLLLIFLIIISCTSQKEEPISHAHWDGWAGIPDNPSKKPFDYFYMKSTGRASEKAISKKSGLMMKTTCTDAATTKVKGYLIGKLVGETLGFREQEDINLSNRIHPLYPLNFFAITDKESNGVVIVRTLNGQIKEVKVKECKPLYRDDPEIPGSEWKECECIIYAHIPGGRDTIIARAKELDKE